MDTNNNEWYLDRLGDMLPTSPDCFHYADFSPKDFFQWCDPTDVDGEKKQLPLPSDEEVEQAVIRAFVYLQSDRPEGQKYARETLVASRIVAIRKLVWSVCKKARFAPKRLSDHLEYADVRGDVFLEALTALLEKLGNCPPTLPEIFYYPLEPDIFELPSGEVVDATDYTILGKAWSAYSKACNELPKQLDTLLVADFAYSGVLKGIARAKKDRRKSERTKGGYDGTLILMSSASSHSLAQRLDKKTDPTAIPRLLDGLSSEEHLLFELLISGYKPSKIAVRLGISEATLSRRREALRQRLTE